MMLHRAPISRWLNTALRITERPSHLELPVFLCPCVRQSIHRRSLASVASTPRARYLQWRSQQQRRLHAAAEVAPSTSMPPVVERSTNSDLPVHKLSKQCTGCGALSQFSLPDQPGYYDLNRKAIRRYLGVEPEQGSRRGEDSIVEDALKHLNLDELEKQGVDIEALGLIPPPQDETRPSQKAQKPPLCDRCHYLLHNHTGKSIYHPTIGSIQDTLLESPYKYNHVYHVLDAADFPMSILPGIHKLLDLMPLRTRNRRSRAGRFYHGQKTELSFIITRSDLLAPTKPQVDRLLPYLQEVLRDALGRSGRDIRLGNIRLVSAKRSWWTKELKEDIWKRGGAGWMVGKVNVGKSQLFEAVFPKGRMNWSPSTHQISVDMYANKDKDIQLLEDKQSTPVVQGGGEGGEEGQNLVDDDSDPYSLLPPAPKETNYPEMPLVSDLPGTTASPIRVPFGNGRGELIDMPGLERTGLERYVREEHRLSLIMKSRIVPEQLVIKPGQSLLIGGGLIRITPRDPAPIILSYAFTPIKPHLTSTEKAVAIQEQTSDVKVENIAVPGTGEKTKLAGSFALEWDVTKPRTGPLTRRDAVGLQVDRLPYRVLSTDILIEGIGWVEITAQVRTKDLFAPRPQSNSAAPSQSLEEAEPQPERELSPLEQLEAMAEDPTKKRETLPPPLPLPPPPQPEKELSALERLEAMAEDPKKKQRQERDMPPPQLPPAETTLEEEGEPNWPVVDVYSPEGKFISNRRPMNGWLLNKPMETAARSRQRPRKSMKGAKKLDKKRKREAAAAAGAGAGGSA